MGLTQVLISHGSCHRGGNKETAAAEYYMTRIPFIKSALLFLFPPSPLSSALSILGLLFCLVLTEGLPLLSAENPASRANLDRRSTHIPSSFRATEKQTLLASESYF